MSSRYLHLLGTVQVQSTGDEVPRFRSQRTIALLGYLVAEQRPVARDRLAALFWPDDPLSTGTGNLRRELHNLSQILPGCWQTDRVQAQFVPSADTRIDLSDLDRFVEAGQWQAAADLIRGDFLEGVYLDHNTEFEMWLLGERERRRQQAEHVLEWVIGENERQGAYREALRYARRLLQLTPWHEETHQRVMRLLALTGQRSEALKQFETCQRVLREELAIEASAETQALYRRIKLHAHFALHNLPADTSPFIGRKAELGLLNSWLSDNRVRLITITGTGGQGKTRLALAAAERFLDSARVQPAAPFQDGIFFVNLAPLDDPSQIVTAIATALDLFMQTSDGRSPRQQLFDHLKQKRMLLILDNVEQLLTGSNSVVDLLEAASGIKVLFTSRERIGAKSEHVLPLGGLAYPVEERRETDEAGPDHEAALLFLTSAQRVLPDFRATTSVKRHVDRICQLVQGLPLALELAAKWVDSMSLPDINAEIERSLSFLQAEAPDLPQRHRSMAAVFESSWKALSSVQQTVLASLSVLQGGFNLDAAKQVANASSGTLSVLAGRSLLRFDHTESRYHMHELLRQYAAARLAEDPALARAVRHRHLAYYCQLAKQGEEHLHGGDQISWTHLLRQETNNIRTAIEWGIDHDLAVAARLASHLYFFWFFSGQSKEGQRHYESLLARKTELPANLRAWVHIGYTSVIWLEGKLDVIKASTEEALQLFQATDDAAGLELAYFNLSFLDYLRADLQSALHNIDVAIQHARLVSTDTWYISHGQMGKAMFLHSFGQHDAVKQIAAEDLPLCQTRGDRILASTHWSRLANIALIEGDLDEAKSLSHQVLAFAQDVKDRRFEAYEYLNLGRIALAEGDPRAALSYLEDGVAISTDGYSLDVLIEICLRLGDTHLELNQPGWALDSYHRSASLCLELHWFEHAADCLERLAYLRWQQKPLSLDAVSWLAAAASWREKANVPLMPPDQARMDRLSKQIREHFPENELARAWQQGAIQSLEEALSSAIVNAGGAPWVS